jgi:hypothetical protein
MDSAKVPSPSLSPPVKNNWVKSSNDSKSKAAMKIRTEKRLHVAVGDSWSSKLQKAASYSDYLVNNEKISYKGNDFKMKDEKLSSCVSILKLDTILQVLWLVRVQRRIAMSFSLAEKGLRA